MKLTLTAQITEALQEWHLRNDISHSGNVGDGWIEHALLYEIARDLKMSLVDLVRGTSVYIAPPPAKPAKSPEYIKLMQDLKLQAQEKEYRELAGLKEEEGPMFGGSDAKQVKEEITTILNFAVSVFAVGFSLWYWAKWWDPASRTLLAILGSLVVLVAEVVVYASYRSKVEQARQVERSTEHKSTISGPDLVAQSDLYEQPAKTIIPVQSKKANKKQKQKQKQKQNTAKSSGSTQPTTLRPRVAAH